MVNRVQGYPPKAALDRTRSKSTDITSPCIPWNNFPLENNSTAKWGIEFRIQCSAGTNFPLTQADGLDIHGREISSAMT